MTQLAQTHKRFFLHFNALCAVFALLFFTFGVIIVTQAEKPASDNAVLAERVNPTDSVFSHVSMLYSFPAFQLQALDSTPVSIRQSGQQSAKMSVQSSALTQQLTSKHTMAGLFEQHVYDVFDKFLYATLNAKLPKTFADAEPADSLELMSATAVMTLAHPDRGGEKYTVVLDPGHGGSDPGTVGANGLLEKELTLEIAQRVRDLLRPHPNITIKLTRNTDRGFSRANRVRHIRAAEGDLLVSLHLNNLPQRELIVVESFYADRDNILESELERKITQMKSGNSAFVKTSSTVSDKLAYTQSSRRIANILQRNIYAEVSSDNPEAIDAGIKSETLYTLTRSEMPGTLIELTCLSNNSEEQRLKSKMYRQRIAESIAEGLLEYFSSPATDTGSAPKGI